MPFQLILRNSLCLCGMVSHSCLFFFLGLQSQEVHLNHFEGRFRLDINTVWSTRKSESIQHRRKMFNNKIQSKGLPYEKLTSTSPGGSEKSGDLDNPRTLTLLICCMVTLNLMTSYFKTKLKNEV